MICPTCHNPMLVVEHHKIELDYCPKCQGVWFDSGELELFLESAKLENTSHLLNHILSAAEAESSEEKRKCPICRQKMKKVVTDQEPKVLIDVCRQGDGLWFDGGEVGHIVKQIIKSASVGPEKPHSEQQVLSFLGEVFKAQE